MEDENAKKENSEKEEIEEIKEETSEVEDLEEKENSEEKSREEDVGSKKEDSEEEVKVEEKPKKKSKFPVFLLVLILLVAACGGYYWWSNQPKDSEKKSIKSDVKEVKSEYRMSGNGLEDFDLYFLKLENEAKNKVYSPLSIKYALAMLAEGTNGDSKKQLEAVIGDYKAKSYPNNEHMSFANAMFIRDSFKDGVKQDYISGLKDKYNAEVILDPFASPENINNWVSDRTFNLVKNLVNDVSEANFFLINALAIDMNWNNQVHCASGHKIPCVNDGMYSIEYLHEKLDDDAQLNYHVIDYPYSSPDYFYGGDGKKHEFNGKEFIKGGSILADFNKYDIIKDLGEDKIKEILKPEYEEWLKTEYGKNDPPFEEIIDKFLDELKENYGKKANSTDFLVYEDEQVKSFAKDLQTYDGSTLQYVGILPKDVELTDYINNINKEEINKVINGLKEVNIDSFEEGYVTRIRGFIPFFDFEYSLKLKEDLQKLGIQDIFDSKKADLSKIIDDDDAYIGSAVHKANIEFSNDGIKAAAATALGGYGAASGPHFEHLFNVPVKEYDVNFNKPFMYLIRDKESGEVWFAGTVYEPIKKD